MFPNYQIVCLAATTASLTLGILTPPVHIITPQLHNCIEVSKVAQVLLLKTDLVGVERCTKLSNRFNGTLQANAKGCDWLPSHNSMMKWLLITRLSPRHIRFMLQVSQHPSWLS